MGLAMKHFVFGWVVFAALCASQRPLVAQTTAAAPSASAATLVEPPAPLLPTDDRLVVNDAAANVPADQPELAGFFTEDGLKRTETRAVMTGGAPAGWVRAYQFVDATGAFAAYTFLRQNGRSINDPSGNTMLVQLHNDERVFLDGVSVVRLELRQHPEQYRPLVAEIEVGLPKIGGRKGLAPLLPTLLPKTGLEESTLRYALGPQGYAAMGGVLPPGILEWDKAAEVATASYSGKAGRGTLTLLMYPTPQIAGDVGRAIEKAVNAHTASLGTVKLRRIGPLLAMTSGTFAPEQATALLASIHLNQEIAFDKSMPPVQFHAEARKTVTLLQSIAIFTGILILAALVLGVFLGGARAGLRVLQGKPAYSDPEFLTIDLRGRPAPLQPSHPPPGDPDTV
jgi:hypothetical protein